MTNERELQLVDTVRESIAEECKNNPNVDPSHVAIDYLIRFMCCLAVQIAEKLENNGDNANG